MIPAPLIALAWKAAPYIIGVVAVVGMVGVHDYRVRAKEAARWKPKLAACQSDVDTATTANVALKADYEAFAKRHNDIIRRLADEQRAALKRRDAALAALGLREQKAQAELEDLRAKAAAGPQPTREASCASAESTLRALAAERLRDAGLDQ